MVSSHEDNSERRPLKRTMRTSPLPESGPRKRLRSNLEFIEKLMKSAPLKWEISETNQKLIRDVYQQAWENDPCMEDLVLVVVGANTPNDTPSRYSQARPQVHGLTLSIDEEQMLRNVMSSVGMNDIEDIAALEAKIHPIFKWENWETPFIFDEGRRHLRITWVSAFPAFIVASKILTGTAVEHYWHHLMCGTLTTRGGKTFLATSPLEDDLPFVRAQFKQLLRCLQERVKFFWDFGSEFHGETHASFWGALARFDLELRHDIVNNHHPDHDPRNVCGLRLDAHIGINSAYVRHLLDGPFQDDGIDNPNVRLHSALATTLCHELCHAMWSLRDVQEEEVRMYETDFEAEVGLSFEHELWGGLIICSDSLAFPNRPPLRMFAREWRYHQQPQHIETLVSDNVIAKLFVDETWDDWDGFLLSVPKPVGKQRSFVAQRLITQKSFAGNLARVVYKDGLVVSAGTKFLNKVDEGPGQEEDLEAWYRRKRLADQAVALATGEWEMVKLGEDEDEVQEGEFGEKLVRKEKAEEDPEDPEDQALWMDLFAADRAGLEGENEYEEDDEDDDEDESDESPVVQSPVDGSPVREPPAEEDSSDVSSEVDADEDEDGVPSQTCVLI